MTKEEKIKAIYKEIADKELTFGCKITTNEYNWDEFKISTADSLAVKEWESYSTTGCGCCSEDLTIKEVIGHPVMIGDVLNRIDGKMWISNCEYEEFIIEEANTVILYWLRYLEPIEEQLDKCIDYVYDLIYKY